MQGITPCLWFDDQAEDAMNFYVGVFPNSHLGAIGRYTEAGPGPSGSVMTVSFDLNGHSFMGINGGPLFTFSEAISFSITCEDQAEVDYYWERLADGGETGQCGWLKDRFGVSWQVVPTALPRLLGTSDAETAWRVTEAMLAMTKLDIAELEAAAQGSS